MKVVLISNFADETIAESLLAGDLNEEEALKVCTQWNSENSTSHSTYYAVVKPDDYVLWRGMADLVGD